MTDQPDVSPDIASDASAPAKAPPAPQRPDPNCPKWCIENQCLQCCQNLTNGTCFCCG